MEDDLLHEQAFGAPRIINLRTCSYALYKRKQGYITRIVYYGSALIKENYHDIKNNIDTFSVSYLCNSFHIYAYRNHDIATYLYKCILPLTKLCVLLLA